MDSLSVSCIEQRSTGPLVEATMVHCMTIVVMLVDGDVREMTDDGLTVEENGRKKTLSTHRVKMQLKANIIFTGQAGSRR